MSTTGDLLNDLLNQTVVIDVSSEFVFLGTLAAWDEYFLKLEDADVHDLRDTTTTRELYVVEAKQLGVRPNRNRVWIRREQIVCVSALEDVLI